MENFNNPTTPQGSEGEFSEASEDFNIPEIATIHRCGHWTLTIPATDTFPQHIIPIDDEYADFEIEGNFVHQHWFLPTPCPAVECQTIPLFTFQRIDDEWIEEGEGWLAHELPHYETRVHAANLLVTCNEVWFDVEKFSPDTLQYFAQRLESRDKFLADIITRGDLEGGPAAMARYALRAVNWLDGAANWWDQGRKAFYNACLNVAKAHLNSQEIALEGFFDALNETELWLRLPMADDYREWSDNGSDSDPGPITLSIADVPWGADLYDMDLADFFHTYRNALKNGAEPYDTNAPTSITQYATYYNHDDSVSSYPVAADEAAILNRDQNMYGPAYTAWMSYTEGAQQQPAAEHSVRENPTSHGPFGEQDAFDEVSTISMDELSEGDDQINSLEEISSQFEQHEEHCPMQPDTIEPEYFGDAFYRYTFPDEQTEATKSAFDSGFQHIFGNGYLDDFEFHFL